MDKDNLVTRKHYDPLLSSVGPQISFDVNDDENDLQLNK